MHHDPTLDPTYPQHYAARIVVRTTDGGVHDLLELVAPGDADDPMSEMSLAAKFVGLVAPVIGAERAEGYADQLGDVAARIPQISCPDRPARDCSSGA